MERHTQADTVLWTLILVHRNALNKRNFNLTLQQRDQERVAKERPKRKKERKSLNIAGCIHKVCYVWFRLEGSRGGDGLSCSVFYWNTVRVQQQWEAGGARKPKQKSRRSAHLPGDVCFGQVMAARGRGWCGGGEDEQSLVRFNGTLADLKLAIYTHTYMQAQTLRCPGFFFFFKWGAGNLRRKPTLQRLHYFTKYVPKDIY